MPAGKIVGNRGDEERGDVRAHVPAVGQQRHRVRKNAGGNFDHHHHAGDGNHDMVTAFAFREVAHEIVRVPKTEMLGPINLPEDSAIIATSAKKRGNWSTINLPEAESEVRRNLPPRSGALRKCKQSPRRKANPTSRTKTIRRLRQRA